MSAAEQVLDMLRATVTLTLRQAKAMSRRETGVIAALMRGKPRSVQEECDYAKSRVWVPARHEGGVAESLGVAHHVLVGRPCTAIGLAWVAVCQSPLSFWLAFPPSFALTLALLFKFGETGIAIWMIVITAIFLVLFIGAAGLIYLESRQMRGEN